jgi:hypothetical protein
MAKLHIADPLMPELVLCGRSRDEVHRNVVPMDSELLMVDDCHTCLLRRAARRLGPMLAYSGLDRGTGAVGFCFATTAAKARMIVYRSGRDAGFDTRLQDIRIGRMPAIDGRVPADYRNQFFTLEHLQHLPLPAPT